MNKLNLKDITLTAIGCKDFDKANRAVKICMHYCDFYAVKLFTHIVSNEEYIIPVKEMSYDDYNYFMVKGINKYVESPYMLFIHPDGWILNPDAWDNSWKDYDYIGAPWWYDDDNNVGNGGFTLRTKKLLDFLANDPEIKPIDKFTHGITNVAGFTPEDHVICRIYGNYLKSRGFKFAPEEVASKFSIEGNGKYVNRWTSQFGFHRNINNLSDWKQPELI